MPSTELLMLGNSGSEGIKFFVLYIALEAFGRYFCEEFG